MTIRYLAKRLKKNWAAVVIPAFVILIGCGLSDVLTIGAQFSTPKFPFYFGTLYSCSISCETTISDNTGRALIQTRDESVSMVRCTPAGEVKDKFDVGRVAGFFRIFKGVVEPFLAELSDSDNRVTTACSVSHPVGKPSITEPLYVGTKKADAVTVISEGAINVTIREADNWNDLDCNEELAIYNLLKCASDAPSDRRCGTDFRAECLCSNGHIDDAYGEQCDDSNSTSGDGCSSLCQIEDLRRPTVPFCGDGKKIDGEEECDDGNATDGDGCDSNCTITGCGNNILTSGETCDDGNTTSGDGCSETCQIEICGDGTINNNGTEACDDGNTTPGDGCSEICQIEPCGDGTCAADENHTSCDKDCKCNTNGICEAGEDLSCPDDCQCIPNQHCDASENPTVCPTECGPVGPGGPSGPSGPTGPV